MGNYYKNVHSVIGSWPINYCQYQEKTLLPYNNSETKASGLLENREEISSWYDMISDDYIQ